MSLVLTSIASADLARADLSRAPYWVSSWTGQLLICQGYSLYKLHVGYRLRNKRQTPRTMGKQQFKPKNFNVGLIIFNGHHLMIRTGLKVAPFQLTFYFGASFSGHTFFIATRTRCLLLKITNLIKRIFVRSILSIFTKETPGQQS